MEHDVSNFIWVPGAVDRGDAPRQPGEPGRLRRIPIKILKVGSLGTHNGLGLALAKGAEFFLASTSEVYGDPLVHPQPEDYWGNVNPIGPRGVYDEAKRFAEAMTMAYHRQHGLDVRIVRIFNTYGPRMRPDDGRVVSELPRAGAARRTDHDLRRRLADALVLLRRRRGPRVPRLARLRRRRRPMNIGNPTTSSRSSSSPSWSLEVTGSKSRDRASTVAGRRPDAAQARHHPGEEAARLGAEGRSSAKGWP